MSFDVANPVIPEIFPFLIENYQTESIQKLYHCQAITIPLGMTDVRGTASEPGHKEQDWCYWCIHKSKMKNCNITQPYDFHYKRKREKSLQYTPFPLLNGFQDPT